MHCCTVFCNKCEHKINNDIEKEQKTVQFESWLEKQQERSGLIGQLARRWKLDGQKIPFTREYLCNINAEDEMLIAFDKALSEYKLDNFVVHGVGTIHVDFEVLHIMPAEHWWKLQVDNDGNFWIAKVIRFVDVMVNDDEVANFPNPCGDRITVAQTNEPDGISDLMHDVAMTLYHDKERLFYDPSHKQQYAWPTYLNDWVQEKRKELRK